VEPDVVTPLPEAPFDLDEKPRLADAVIAAHGDRARNALGRAREDFADLPKLVFATDEAPECLARSAYVFDEQPRHRRHGVVALAQRLELEERLHLPHRHGRNRDTPFSDAGEIARRRHERAEALVVGRLSGARDVDACGVDAGARPPLPLDAAKGDERASRGHLRVAPVGIVEAEECGDLLGGSLVDTPAVALDDFRDVITDGRGATRQLDDERGHLAPFAHFGGPIDRDDPHARVDAREAGRLRARSRDLDGCALGRPRRRPFRVEQRRCGERRARRPRFGIAKATQELGKLVRAVAAAVRVEEREERFVHSSRVGEAIGRILRHRMAGDRDEIGRRVGSK
jgi:hypothetical protein